MLRVINRVVQATSLPAVGWTAWQAIQERLTPGLMLVVLAVVLLSIATQYLVLRQESRDPSSAHRDRPPEHLL